MLNEILFHHVGYVVADIRLSAAQFAQLGYVAGEILYDEGLQVELCYLTKEGAPLVELVHQLQSGSLEASLLHANGVMPYHLAYEALGFDKACEELLAQSSGCWLYRTDRETLNGIMAMWQFVNVAMC